MDNEEEKYPYQIDKLDIKTKEEIENMGSERDKINFIIHGAVAITLKKHTKAEDCKVYMKTFHKELTDAFNLFEIDFSKNFVLVASTDVSGVKDWNWSTPGTRGAVYYTDKELKHKFMAYVY